MKKIAIITMMILLIAGLFVACNQDEIVDDQLNSKITITFDANGGTGSMAPLTVKKGDAVKLPVVKFTKEGNIFVWWEDKSGNAYGDEVTIYPDADLVLYAQWMEVIDITSSTTSMTPGKAYRTKDATTTITERITVEDGEEAVVVILTEGTTLKAQKGIEVKAGEKLVIQGSGKLNATSTGDEAGIGGGTGDDKDSGDIIIEGGEITVTGGTGGGAGIGGGKGGKGGVINLEGGKINTTGGTGGGSGIGGGEGGDFETINITGGEITSNGGKDAAGIGGGAGGKGGTINISGGKTKAQGNGGGSGIGGGKGEKVETIRIGKTDVDTPEIEAIGGETGDTVGIGKGAGSAGEDEIILIDMRLKCGPTETPEYWELYDEETPNPQKVMATLNNDVTVTFNANNGTGSMPVQVVPAGKATTLKGNDFTRKGYAFKGWAKSATATAKDYDDGAPVTLTQDTVLYAYWEVSTIEPFPTTEPVVLAGGVYKTEENKTITLAQRVRLKGTDSVTIIVAKGTTLDTKGITVTESQTLVIETEEGAKLIADAYKVGESSYSESYAGIGGEYDNSPSSDKTCGTIVIKGKGTVIATGGISGGAGIGGSRENDGGVITINSGNVIATGNGGGAGIGGGCGGNGGTITFNGGTVEANGKAGGAGIGGGRKNTAAGGNGGTINIYEGAIVATGEEGGAGIGGGGNCGNSGKITVKRSSPTSLTIFATGGDSGSGSGDGLGRGYGGSEYRNIDSGDFLRYRDNTTEGWKIVGPSSSGKYVRTDGAVTVKFDGNGATQGSMTDITNVILGDTVELPKNTFTNGDKIFMGWNDRADGNGNGCADEMSFQVTKETTLYAQWATYTTMTSSDKVLEGGKAYKVSGDITIADRVTIDGNTPVLIYLDKTSLTAEQGITVKEGQTLIIGGADDEYSYLSAELVPTEHNGAGIGSGDGTTCGTIIINGGRIEARGNIDCAGIGGGKYSGCDNGTVVINGGDVTATGRDYAAGIGGGKSGNGGVITINGGTVKAYGQSYESSSNLGGAGIGGGLSGSGGVITITGGTVTATGSMYGAGIGSGHATNPGECNGGIITITGGSVKAYGGKNGAGIGGGHCANSGTTSIKKIGEYSPVVYAMAGDKDTGVVIAPEGIGHGGSISTSSTAINLDGVTLAVSSDDTNWDPYDGSNRNRYMKTSNY